MKKKWKGLCIDHSLKSKLLLKMKLLAFILFVSIASVSANSYSQQTKFNMSFKDITVRQVFQEIEDNSEFIFLYSEKSVDLNRKVNISAKEKNVDFILSQLFNGTNNCYEIDDRQIAIMMKKETKVPVKSIKKDKKNIEQPQKKTISGKVTDKKGEPLPGVSIIVKGTTIGITTDVDGNYTFEIPVEAKTLVFSFMGMKTHEVALNGKTTISVVLKENAIGIDEVVAVGYGVQKKVNLTGAIGIAKGEVLENRPISNVLEGLQGVVGGLNITNANGQPGSKPKINIRGATSISGGSPLVLVDGAQMDLNQVNPDDIESISVLKDAASAAIYGARAAYGVILVTTKSGKRNTKTTVTYNANFFAARPTILPEKSDSYKYALYVNEMRRSDGRSTPFNEEHLGLIKATVDGTGTPGVYYTLKPNNGYYEHANTNWSDLVFDDAAPGQNHNLAISGGTEKTGYHASFAYTGYDGLMKIGGDRYDRYNFNLKLDTDIFDWLTSYFQVNFSKSSTNVYNPIPGHGDNILHTTWRARPTLTPTMEKDGMEYPTFARLNPVSTLEHSGRNVNSQFNLNTKAGVKMTFGKFNVFSNFTYNPYFVETVQNNNSIKSVIPWKPNNPVRTDGKPTYIRKATGINNYYAFDAYGQYENTFANKHYVKAMVGYNQEWKTMSGVTAYNTDLISTDVISLRNSTGDPIVTDSYNQWALRSGFIRLNYIFKDKYMLEVNGRYDGSSRFKQADRFGFFPSISTGWRMSEESFMNDVSFVDNLKLRASYGSLGNQSTGVLYPVSAYNTISQVAYNFDGARPVGIQPGSPLGDTRTWETVSTIDVGLDVTLFQGLDLTIDAYRRTTENMLVSGDALPGVYGASAPQVNAADLEVNGWEASLGWRGKVSNGIIYNMGFTISDWKGKITKFDNPTKSLSKAYYEGQVIGEIWGYETVGLFKTQAEIDAAADHTPLGAGNLVAPGDVHYADLNNDGEINIGENTVDKPGDRKIIGNRTPRYSYAIRGGMEWKGFDFNFFFQGVAKRDFWLTGPLVFGGVGGYGNVIVTDELYDNVWSDGTSGIPENRDAFYFRPSEYAIVSRNSQVQTRYLQNAAYLRLKNVTFGYSLPNSLINKIGIAGCRIFVSGENLLTFTKLRSNFDPEVLIPNESSQNSVNPSSGSFYSGKAYPLSKRLSVGINVRF
jgi:TonB-linked SusC/RagA family outer membrane protein